MHGAGKPLILLHGGVNPDSFGSNLAELAKNRQVIAIQLQAHGRTPDTDRPLRCETLGDGVAALIGHLNIGKAPGRGLFVGGVTLLLALAELGLIDEYEFVVHPRLAGHEPTLFAGAIEVDRLEACKPAGVRIGGNGSAV